jgi:renierapurpurin 18,18'-hydroxylase
MPESFNIDAHQPPCHDLRRVSSHPDHWYPLAWSREVKSGRSYAAHFAGEPIVLVRPQGKPVFALEDRCAHSQVPLSMGIITECAIRCCYHGWSYDAAGACVDVPYIGKGKLPNGVRAYPCREQDGLILIWPGDPRTVTELAPLGAVGDRAFKTRRFGREVRCHYSFMHENLMDMNHQFLHRRNMGQIVPRYRGAASARIGSRSIIALPARGVSSRWAKQ